MRALGRGSISSFVTLLLNIAWSLVALGLVLAVLLLVASPFVKDQDMEVDASWLVVGTKMTIPVSFNVDARTHHVAAPSLGIDAAQIQDVNGSLKFPTRKGAFFFANVILVIILFALAMWVLGQLRAVFRTLRDGQPFVPANATRIRWVAFGVIAGELVRTTVVYFENYYAMMYFSADGLQFEAWPHLNLIAIIDGLIILVIAEVFRAGTRLAEEQSLTV
jgi:hypothetical protein